MGGATVEAAPESRAMFGALRRASGRLFRSWQLPPVALTHGPNFSALPRRGAKTVITVLDLAFRHFPDDYPADVVAALSGRLAAQQHTVDLVICISSATEADLVDASPGFAGRTTVIPLGVDAAWFANVDRRETEEVLKRLGIVRPYLLHLGALVPRKNLVTVVQAWMQAHADHPELALVLAGPDAVGWKSDLATIRALVPDGGDLSGHMHLVGYVDDPTARALMAGAQAYVCGSKSEGFGLPVLEAMAAGIPTIATRIPAIEEVAGETVTYVPVGDPEATAYAIGRVVDRFEPAEVEAARTRAREFSWARCSEQTLAAYLSLTA
jgi:alpha-1,3-rhamnosyl/mannosyltransferase